MGQGIQRAKGRTPQARNSPSLLRMERRKREKKMRTAQVGPAHQLRPNLLYSVDFFVVAVAIVFLVIANCTAFDSEFSPSISSRCVLATVACWCVHMLLWQR